MLIREATDLDTKGILSVLKASLGEVSSKKTAEVWRFKHVENPFGKSLVLVAEEGGMIVGVRAFMRWRWQEGPRSYAAFRAVDTATHPDHQGKGIFKKLTLKALELGRENGDHFVFNTPNAQSKPGYLKMGWEEVGKLKIRLMPVNPFHWKKQQHLEEYPVTWSEKRIPELLMQHNKNLENSGRLFTPKSKEYLTWRYVQNPLQKYRVLATDQYFIAGYVKEHSRLRELRISELILHPSSATELKKELRAWAKHFGVHVVSFTTPGTSQRPGLSLSGAFGPVLTFRNIGFAKGEDKGFLNLETWAYSLGDLELF